MDEVEEKTKNALEFLRSIKTLDDMKEHKDEVLDLVVEIIKAGLDVFNKFLEESLSMSDEEKEKGMEKFQDESFMFSPEIEEELDRITELPGAEEYMAGFEEEMKTRLEPYLEEYFGKIMSIMGDFMGGMMEGMMQGIGEAFGEMGKLGDDGESDQGEMETEEEVDDRERLDFLYNLYVVKSLEDLKENRNEIIQTIDEGLVQYDLWELQTMASGGYFEGDDEKLENLEKRLNLLETELKNEFDRLSKIPEVAEHAKELRQELDNKISPKTAEMHELIPKIRDNWAKEKENAQ